MIGTGYDWKQGNWTFGPAATVQYSDVRMNSFQEGRSLGALQIQEQSEDAFHSTLEFKVSYEWKTCGVIVRPDLRVGWQMRTATKPILSRRVLPPEEGMFLQFAVPPSTATGRLSELG